MNEKKSNMPEHITEEFLNLIKLPSANGKELKYLFVMPRMANDMKTAYRIPYGFCMVSSALKASGRTVYTLNLNYHENPYELLRETIIKNKVDVVLTGGLSGQYAILKEILDTSKQISSDTITCIGGGIITADPIVAMKALETADYGMIGEGEFLINELAYALENNEDVELKPGFVTKVSTTYIHNKEIENLDILPFPDYDGFEIDMLMRNNILHFRKNYGDNGMPITMGRSCIYNCTFCFHGVKYRRRSFESVREELDWVQRKYPNVQLIQFFDEMFGNDMEFLIQITDYMKEHHLKYQLFNRVDYVSREMLMLLKESGCVQVFLGVESADNRILKSMRKNITIEQVEYAYNLALEVGLNASGNLIFGDLAETPETISNTINWWKYHPEYNITMAWIFTFPGSYLYKVACERGIISDKIEYLKQGNMQLNLTSMSDELYLNMVQKVSIFNILISNGIDANFNEMDHVIEIIKDRLEELVQNHKVAIWPTKYDTIVMLNRISSKFVSSENIYFVNIDPTSTYVNAAECFGKKVYGPDDILTQENIDTVLFILGNRNRSNIFYNQIKEASKSYPNIKQLVRFVDFL